MVALIATALCLVFIVHLFLTDPRPQGSTTTALWIPTAWMFFAGSRYLSSWLSFSSSESFSYDDGSPMDRMLFLLLLAAGMVVLIKRRVAWGAAIGANKLLVLYFAYCLVSAAWSSEPDISVKRWIKDLGNPVMVLIVLTEPAPLAAVGVLMRRLAYLLIPLSVLFVRYYPELGRVYAVDGTPMFTGVGQQKNALGQMCLVIGIYAAWQLLQDRATYSSWKRLQRWSMLAWAAMLAWLLYLSNSQTSLACLLVAVAVLLAARLPHVQRRPSALVGLVLTAGVSAWILDATIGVRDTVYALLGRDPSLTSRTEVWALLYDFSSDPVLGAGFMSFWTGERMAAIWEQLGSAVLQAHSGYIEQYLNLGYVGLGLTILLLVAGFFRLRRQLDEDAAMSTLRLSYLCAAALYNYTEASFYGVSNVWIVLLLALITLVPAQRSSEPAVDHAQADPDDDAGSRAARGRAALRDASASSSASR
jgi:exopolysaccharide production protein ExoQ